MPMKKPTRTRSNWYIYLLTFGITFALLSFIVLNLWDLLFPEKTPVMASAGTDYRPDASYNTTILLMMSKDKGGTPDYFMLMNYRPRDEVVVLVPIKPNLYTVVGNTRGTLSELYQSGGADSVIFAIKNALDVTCEHYIKFDKNSFTGFFNSIGYTPVNIPNDLKSGDLVFMSGSYELSGDDLYSYLTFPEFNEGDDYRCVVHGSAISGFINKNSRNLTVTQMQSIFNKILNTTDTNLEFSIFTKKQQAYLYTTQNSYNIAEYYIPYGEIDDNGNFTIAESSIATIKDRFGL